MSTYFSDRSFRFLRGLARHNERAWFHAHKTEYETHVREPFQRLLGDLQPALALISPHFQADPRVVGGSLFRIQRDIRFASDKSPYKSWQGARLFHERRRELPAPSFYLHLQAERCFVGAGLWHPEVATQRRVRQFIFENPAGWNKAAHARAFQRRYDLESGQSLIRPPRGFPPEFEFIHDLRRKSFVATRRLQDTTMTGPRLRQTLERDLAALAPFIDYLCAALDLEF